MRCPPLAAGSPTQAPKEDTLAMGDHTVRVWRCPPETGREAHDVVHVAIDGLLSRRLVGDLNWVGNEMPPSGGASVQVLGPFAGGNYALVVRMLDYGPGTGTWDVYVGPSRLASVSRSFPGGGGVRVEGGELIGADGALTTLGVSDLAELDASYRWTEAGWVDHGTPRLRSNYDTWPCDDRAVPVVAQESGLPTGTSLRIARGASIAATAWRVDAAGAPLFLVRASGVEAWVRQVTQDCVD